MKKLFFCLLLSSLLTAQKTEIIGLKENIKDKKGLTKSLTFIDNRPDKNVVSISDKNENVELKFADENLKVLIENRFIEDYKETGNNDIVLMFGGSFDRSCY